MLGFKYSSHQKYPIESNISRIIRIGQVFIFRPLLNDLELIIDINVPLLLDMDKYVSSKSGTLMTFPIMTNNYRFSTSLFTTVK